MLSISGPASNFHIVTPPSVVLSSSDIPSPYSVVSSANLVLRSSSDVSPLTHCMPTN